MSKWDQRMLDLAQQFATWSKDPSSKVGAVIVDSKRRVIGHGYNGFPRRIKDRPERYQDRAVKYPRVVHAELNAILNAVLPRELEGSTLYVTHPSCSECAKAIIQSGITRVVWPEPIDSEWYEAHGGAVALEMFAEAGVEVGC